MISSVPVRGRRAWPITFVVLPLLAIFFVALGVHIVYDSAYGLGRRYDVLRQRGVQVDGQVVTCAPGIGGGRGVGCRVRLVYGSSTRTWNYPENTSQFERTPPGSPVQMLVDPQHPSTAYTVRDVEDRTNAGTGPLLGLGVVYVVVGLAGLLWSVRLVHRLRHRPPGVDGLSTHP